jgi:hypothetical protein
VKITNIDRLLIYREDDNGHVLNIDELQQRYGTRPPGTNFYYGINDENVGESVGVPHALNATDRGFIKSLVDDLIAGRDEELTLVLGVEPKEKTDPYGFVAKNLDLVRKLATDLNEFQAQAREKNRRFIVIVRYASEMNSGDNRWGLKPHQFKASFVQVRSIFHEAAPGVSFSFSPALRADRDEAQVTDYWPGDEYVDIIGGTWYIGDAGQRQKSINMMKAYFSHRKDKAKSFGLSEIGGYDAKKGGNDAVLQDMLHELEGLQILGISFKYATIFLQSNWGKNATLAFLRN